MEHSLLKALEHGPSGTSYQRLFFLATHRPVREQKDSPAYDPLEGPQG